MLGGHLGSLHLSDTLVADEPWLIIPAGQSNAVGQADYGSATGTLCIDPSTGDQNAFPNVSLNSQIAQGLADPPTWINIATGALQPYAASGQVNMGCELTLGRALWAAGVRAKICKFAISATGLQLHWLPAATFPTTPPNLYTQFVTYIQARMAEFGTKRVALVWLQGETDAITTAQANAYNANLQTFMAALRASLGVPVPIVISRLSNNQTVSGNNAVSTVQAQQDAYVAQDPQSRIVNTDDFAIPGGLHYSARDMESLGDRLDRALLSLIKPNVPAPVLPGTIPFYVGAGVGYGSVFPTNYTPKWWEFAQDGDIGLLVVQTDNGGASAVPTLATAAGFALLKSSAVSTDGVSWHYTAVYWCRATTAVINANGGHMPSPTVNGNLGNGNAGRIFVFRGCVGTGNPWEDAQASSNNADGTAVSLPSVTTVSANDLIALFATGDVNNTTNVLSGLTNAALSSLMIQQQAPYSLAPSLSHRSMICLATGIKATAGATGATTATYSAATLQNNIAIALKGT